MAEKTTKTNETKYKVEELATSKRFAKRRDLVLSLLGDGEYTVYEVEDKIKEYLKRKVK